MLREPEWSIRKLRLVDAPLEFLADVAGTRGEHQPNEVFCVETNFDEVVTTTQRAELLHCFCFAIVNAAMQLVEVVPTFPIRRFVHRLFILAEPGWNCFFDRESQVFQLAVKDAALKWRLHGHHAS